MTTTARTTLNYTTLEHTTLYYTTAHNTTAHYTTLHYTNHTTPQLQLQLQVQLHYSNYIIYATATTPPRYSYNYNCVAPHYIQQLWARWPLQPVQPLQKNTTPTTLRSISGFALPSLHHNSSPFLLCPIFETSPTALRGTTGRMIAAGKQNNFLWGKTHLFKECIALPLLTRMLHVEMQAPDRTKTRGMWCKIIASLKGYRKTALCERNFASFRGMPHNLQRYFFLTKNMVLS